MADPSKRPELADLTDRIKQAGSKAAPMQEYSEGPPTKLSNLGFDFMGAVLGGALMGWILDKAIPVVAPWALIVSIFLGFAGGILNVWRGLQPKTMTTKDTTTKEQG